MVSGIAIVLLCALSVPSAVEPAPPGSHDAETRLDTAEDFAARALGRHGLGRTDEAEVWARRGIALDSDSELARYALGTILLHRGRELGLAADHLRAAAARFPQARLALAEALIRLGKPDEAQRELRRFLDAER